jgi:glycosyltransferase involved in cell wall biosynthesis
MMDPQKVLYVEMAHDMGGSLVSLYQLVRGLDRQRYDPVLLFYWDNPYLERFRELDAKVIVWSGPRQDQDPPVPVPLPAALDRSRRAVENAAWLQKLYHRAGTYARFTFQTMPLAWRIQRIIRKHGIDLVHANDLIGCNREVIIAARLSGKPCVCHIRAFEHYTALDRMLIPFVDQFVFISNAIAQDSIAQGADPTKGAIVYNALELDEFQAVPADDGYRSELGLGPDDLVVGIVGRIVPWKGHVVFLRAMAQVAHMVPNLKCLIIGDAAANDQAYKEELVALTQELGIQGKVLFLGWRSDVSRLLSTLDVLVHASLQPEPFGRVLIEGMAAAKPVVAANAGACPEIIEHGVSGMLFPPGDHQALAQAVSTLLHNPDQRRSMGIVARHQVESRFTIQKHVEQIERIYDDLLC